MKKQLPMGQRAQCVTFTNAKEMKTLSWGWMHRASLTMESSQMVITFPGLLVVIDGVLLSDLMGDIAVGTVTHISAVKPGEPECHDPEHWHVAGVEFRDPDAA